MDKMDIHIFGYINKRKNVIKFSEKIPSSNSCDSNENETTTSNPLSSPFINGNPHIMDYADWSNRRWMSTTNDKNCL